MEHDVDELRCPECGRPSPRYDTRRRRWRHLDTCQYRTILAAEVPRERCGHHGVKRTVVPWNASRWQFTALLEALVIDWLREATISAVALQTARTWACKEHAMTLWTYRTRGWARRARLTWYRSAIRCRRDPVKRVARMTKRNLDGIVTAVVQRPSRVDQRRVQKVKDSAGGFRSRKAIRKRHLHLGVLDLYPVGVIPWTHAFHPNS